MIASTQHTSYLMLCSTRLALLGSSSAKTGFGATRRSALSGPSTGRNSAIIASRQKIGSTLRRVTLTPPCSFKTRRQRRSIGVPSTRKTSITRRVSAASTPRTRKTKLATMIAPTTTAMPTATSATTARARRRRTRSGGWTSTTSSALIATSEDTLPFTVQRRRKKRRRLTSVSSTRTTPPPPNRAPRATRSTLPPSSRVPRGTSRASAPRRIAQTQRAIQQSSPSARRRR
mmetsp:Transcript_11800/g.29489  ORF Transcript_11800/g.29489 Transcript_11800/m.29489 type:complete len:231 (-) Transcript_11800:1111-1803(-)